MGRILPDLTQLQTAELVAAPTLPRRRGRVRRIAVEAVKALILEGKTNSQITEELGCSLATVASRRKEAGLTRSRSEVRKQHRQPQLATRHAARNLEGRTASMPPFNHPALLEAHTMYPSSITPIEGANSVLVDGVNAWKIGAQITKGRWRGFRIYTLTLEERATCPISCARWRSCYGNSMHLAKRLVHGSELEERLLHELAIMQSRHPKGFAVRLHVLGDFYSVKYVELWRSFLEKFPALHVFGFSARHDIEDPIAVALMALVDDHWLRFAVRFSNAPMSKRSTVTIEHPLQKPADAILCPQQLGKTNACATCALCWQTEKRVAFLMH